MPSPVPVFFNLVELNLVYNADYVSVFYFEYNLGLVYNASHLYLEICLIFFNLIKLNFVYNVDYVSVFYDFTCAWSTMPATSTWTLTWSSST